MELLYQINLFHLLPRAYDTNYFVIYFSKLPIIAHLYCSRHWWSLSHKKKPCQVKVKHVLRKPLFYKEKREVWTWLSLHVHWSCQKREKSVPETLCILFLPLTFSSPTCVRAHTHTVLCFCSSQSLNPWSNINVQ